MKEPGQALRRQHVLQGAAARVLCASVFSVTMHGCMKTGQGRNLTEGERINSFRVHIGGEHCRAHSLKDLLCGFQNQASLKSCMWK